MKKLIETRWTPEKFRAGQADWLARRGFNEEGDIYVITLPNTYNIRDDIKAEGGRYSDATGWYLSNPSDKFPTVKVNKDELFNDVDGILQWKDYNEIKQLIQDRIPDEQKKSISKSEYQGEIGQKIILNDIEITNIRGFDTQFGYTHLYTFKDKDENIYTWFSSNGIQDADIGTHLCLVGKIKDHKEFRDEKQTVLTRCVVKYIY